MPSPALYEIVFPSTAFPVPDSTATPGPPFNAMTFFVPAAVPPIVLSLEPDWTATPPSAFGIAADAVAFVPMKFPSRKFPVVVASRKRTP